MDAMSALERDELRYRETVARAVHVLTGSWNPDNVPEKLFPMVMRVLDSLTPGLRDDMVHVMAECYVIGLYDQQ